MRSKTWKAPDLKLRVFSDSAQRFRTLKVEGSSAQDVGNARRTLDQILTGIILMAGDTIV